MKKSPVYAAVALLLVLCGSAFAHTAGPRVSAFDGDAAVNCESLTPPPDVLTQVPVKRSPVVTLDVLVVTDPADLDTTRKVMLGAARAYRPLGIRLIPTIQTTVVPDLGEQGETYIEWLKQSLGGVRPSGFDVVYLAMSHKISIKGQADCIGGVAHPSMAFAVGMITLKGIVGVSVEGYELPQGPDVPNGGAKIAAHEIGHLLGAHHHYGQCGAGMSLRDAAHPCDVMQTVSIQNLGLHFGPLTASTIRHFALSYAHS